MYCAVSLVQSFSLRASSRFSASWTALRSRMLALAMGVHGHHGRKSLASITHMAQALQAQLVNAQHVSRSGQMSDSPPIACRYTPALLAGSRGLCAHAALPITFDVEAAHHVALVRLLADAGGRPCGDEAVFLRVNLRPPDRSDKSPRRSKATPGILRNHPLGRAGSF
jgi:hypothetical protein